MKTMSGTVAVTGMGIVCAIGNNQQEVLDSLKTRSQESAG